MYIFFSLFPCENAQPLSSTDRCEHDELIQAKVWQTWLNHFQISKVRKKAFTLRKFQDKMRKKKTMVGLAGLDQAVKSCFCMDDSGKKVCNVKSAPIIKKLTCKTPNHEAVILIRKLLATLKILWHNILLMFINLLTQDLNVVLSCWASNFTISNDKIYSLYIII